MRNLQETFNAVIDHGIYGGEHGGEYMCDALMLAKHEKIISEEECLAARKAIEDRLQGHYLLHTYIVITNVCIDFYSSRKATAALRLAIYKDWENFDQLINEFTLEDSPL